MNTKAFKFNGLSDRCAARPGGPLLRKIRIRFMEMTPAIPIQIRVVRKLESVNANGPTARASHQFSNPLPSSLLEAKGDR